MSMQAINFALTLPVDEPGPRLLLLLIAHHINWKTGDMYVSQEELAQEARMSSRSIRNHLGTLQDSGLIVRTPTRGDDGRRSVDRISLVGYLEWQDVLYNGGTIPSPEGRRKAANKPAENSSGCEDANRKDDASQPEKSGEPTGSSFPVYKEPSLTLNKPSERASAHATQGAARSAQEVEEPRLILPGDDTWRLWLNWLDDKGQSRAKKAFIEEGGMVVFSYRPDTASPMPKLPPRAGTEKHAQMMSKRARLIRNPADGSTEEQAA